MDMVILLLKCVGAVVIATLVVQWFFISFGAGTLMAKRDNQGQGR